MTLLQPHYTHMKTSGIVPPLTPEFYLKKMLVMFQLLRIFLRVPKTNWIILDPIALLQQPRSCFFLVPTSMLSYVDLNMSLTSIKIHLTSIHYSCFTPYREPYSFVIRRFLSRYGPHRGWHSVRFQCLGRWSFTSYQMVPQRCECWLK